MTTTSLPHICNCCPNSTQQPLFCWLQHLWLGQLLSLPPPLPNHTHWSGLIRGQCHCSLPLFLPCTKSLEAGKGTNHRNFNLRQATSSHDETYLVVFVKNTCLWWSLHSLSFLGPWPQLLRRSQCRHLPAPCPRPSFASAVTLSLKTQFYLSSDCNAVKMPRFLRSLSQAGWTRLNCAWNSQLPPRRQRIHRLLYSQLSHPLGDQASLGVRSINKNSTACNTLLTLDFNLTSSDTSTIDSIPNISLGPE